METISVILLKLSIFALLVSAIVPMLEGVETAKPASMSNTTAVGSEKCHKVGEKCITGTLLEACCKGLACVTKPGSPLGAAGICKAESPMLEGAKMAKPEAVTTAKPSSTSKTKAVSSEKCRKVGEICSSGSIGFKYECCEGSECVLKSEMPGAPGICKAKCIGYRQKCNQGTLIGCCQGFECVPDPKHKGLLGAGGTCEPKCVAEGQECSIGTLTGFCCHGLECVNPNKPKKGVLLGGKGTCKKKM